MRPQQMAYATIERKADKVAKNKAVNKAAKKAAKYRYNYYEEGEDDYVF